MKNPWVIIGVIAVVLIGGSVWYSQSAAEKYNEGVEPVSEHVKGNPEASVVLVEYSDFQCPACAQFYPVVKDVLEEFGDDVRFEYKHFPLVQIHPHAEPAARAAEAAGQQDKFFEFHDMLFENQTTWGNSVNPTQYFLEYAEELNLDVDLFQNHMRASLIADMVNEDSEEAQSKGFTGTPTFTLNGERMIITTFEDFRNQIAAAIDPNVEFGVEDEATTGTETENSTNTENVEANIEFGI